MRYIIHFIFFSLSFYIGYLDFDASYSPIRCYYRIFERQYSMKLVSWGYHTGLDRRLFISPSFYVLKSPSTQQDCFKFWLDLSKELAYEISNIAPEVIITDPEQDVFLQKIKLYFLYPDLTQRMYPEVGAIKMSVDGLYLEYYKVEDFNLVSMTKKITIEEFMEVAEGKKTLDFDPENDPSIKFEKHSQDFFL